MNAPKQHEHDVLILGAGHNSLILQAYLAREGLKTASIERRHVAGGGLCTMEDPNQPGFLHNTHSFFHRAITDMPWYKDLELAYHGARYLEPELNTALVLKNGDVLEWWTDFDRTADSFERFDKEDAKTLRRWRDDFLPIVQQILGPESQSPPLAPEERTRLLQKTPEGRLLLKVSELSPLEFVEKEFRHPVIQAGLLFFNGLREVDLRCKGFGHHIASLLASPRKAQMAVGGSAKLSRALENVVLQSGGDIVTNRELKRILVENGRAVGVETVTGEIFRARRAVVSGLNPHQTFIDLMDEGAVSAEWRKNAENFQYNLIAPLFGLYLNLKEAPVYKAEKKHPDLAKAFMIILGLEGIEQYPEIVRHHQEGTIPPTVMWGCCPSRFDPGQAPAGCHTAFMWEKLPYFLHGQARNWDTEKDPHGEEMLKLWTEYAPNLKDAVLGSFTRSALDTERTLPNMRHGDLLIGAFTNGQIGYNRPFPGAGHYRTEIEGLYLCGSCCHPGGNITGLPGYNATQIILHDLGLEVDSMPQPLESRLAAV